MWAQERWKDLCVKLFKNGRKWHVFIILCSVPDAFFYWSKRCTVKAAFKLLCIFIPQRSQSTWSILSKVLSVPQLLHSGIRGYSEVPQKPLLPNLPAKLFIRWLPAHVGPTQTGEPKPPLQTGHQSTPGDHPLWWDSKPQVWTAQLLQHQEGLCSMWNTLRIVLFLVICSYPPGYFCLHSVPFDFLPHLRNGTINDCKYNLAHLWWSILKIITKCLPGYLISPFFHLFCSWTHYSKIYFLFCSFWLSSFWSLFLQNLAVLMKYRKEMKLQAAFPCLNKKSTT